MEELNNQIKKMTNPLKYSVIFWECHVVPEIEFSLIEFI